MAWTLMDTWDHSVSGNTASPLAFTGLAGAQDIMIVVRDVTLSVAGFLGVQVSIDNGANYYNTSGDYVSMNDAGVISNADYFRITSTSIATARAGHKIIHATNVNGIVKPDSQSEGSRRHQFRASLSPIDAVQLIASAGGNFTGGFVYCLGRF